MSATAKPSLVAAVRRDLAASWLPLGAICLLAGALSEGAATVGLSSAWIQFTLSAVYTVCVVWGREGRVGSLAEALVVVAGNALLQWASSWLAHTLTALGAIWAYLPAVTVIMWGIERVHHWLLLRRQQVPYVLHFEGGLQDNLMAASLALATAAAVWLVPGDVPPPPASLSWRSALAVLPYMLVYDFVVGVPHLLAHRVPSMWQRHKIHHAYGTDLNCAANVHAELLDGAVMALPVVAGTALGALLIGDEAALWTALDLAVLAFHSHHMRGTAYVGCPGALYMVDILCDTLLCRKLAAFHFAHHTQGTRHFSLFGIVSDRVIAAAAQPLLDWCRKQQ